VEHPSRQKNAFHLWGLCLQDPRDSLQIVNHADGSPAAEQRFDGRFLSEADLEQQPAPGLEHLAGLGDQAFIDFQPRRPGVKSGLRLEIRHLELQDLSFCDVRRIRYDQVKVSTIDGCQQIGLQKLHPI